MRGNWMAWKEAEIVWCSFKSSHCFALKKSCSRSIVGIEVTEHCLSLIHFSLLFELAITNAMGIYPRKLEPLLSLPLLTLRTIFPIVVCWKSQCYRRTWSGMCPHYKAAPGRARTSPRTRQLRKKKIHIRVCFLSFLPVLPLSSLFLYATSSPNLSFLQLITINYNFISA